MHVCMYVCMCVCTRMYVYFYVCIMYVRTYVGMYICMYVCVYVCIKSRIAMAKAAFSKKKALFTSKLDLNLRKKLIKFYIWSMAVYGVETWTLQAADQKYLESFENWC